VEKLRNLFSLHQKVAIVTGGNTGLGYDIACALAEFGAIVAITSRTLDKAEAVAHEISSHYGTEVVGVQLDQTEYSSCQRMSDTVHDRFGRIDILFNNAGGGSGKGECDFLKRDPQLIRNMIESNLVGPLFCSQTVGRYMVEQCAGSIINMGSIAALVGRTRKIYHDTYKMEQPIEYAAAKGGVLGFAKDLAAYMAPFGVRVNVISPGGFDKGELSQDFVKAYATLTPLGHMGVMHKEILGAALFLASEASSYVTGQNLVVDGGFSTCK
jgi:gluconate 5-dehydrogenase